MTIAIIGTPQVATTSAQEAAYDTWFKAQVQAALDDPRPRLPHEQVKAAVYAKIAEVHARQARAET